MLGLVGEKTTASENLKPPPLPSRQPAGAPRAVAPWAVALLIVSVALNAVASHLAGVSLAYHLGKLLGQSIGLLVLAAIVVTASRAARKDAVFNVFVVLFVCLSIYHISDLVRQWRTMAEFRDALTPAFAHQRAILDGNIPPPDSMPGPTGTSLKAVMAKYGAEDAKFVRSYIDLNIEQFEAQKLASAEWRRNTRRKFDAARDLIKNYRSSLPARAPELEAAMIQLTSAEERDTMLRSFRPSMDLALKSNLQLLDVKMAIMDQVESLLDFLDANEGHYSTKGPKIVFEQGVDFTPFNETLAKIDSLGAEELKRQNELREKLKASMDKIETLMK